MLAWEKANGVNRRSSKYWEQLERAERLHGPSPYQGRMGDKATGIFWPTPNVPNGGRVNPAGTSPTGMTPDGQKKQIGLEEIARAWATPTSHERTHSPRAVDHGEQLANQAALWNTPRVGTHGQPGARNTATGDALEPQAQKWATPTTRDWKSDDPSQSPEHSPPLGRQVLQTETAGSDGSGKAVLNPSFVEALMNFPPDWTVPTVSARSETPSCPPKLEQPSAGSQGGC